MLLRVHVNQHIIRSNSKGGLNSPPLTCKTYKENYRVHGGSTELGSRVCYEPDKPLSCGAKVWMEFDCTEVIVKTVNGKQVAYVL